MAIGTRVESRRLSMAVSAVAQAALVEGDVHCLLWRLRTEAVEVLGCSRARVVLVDDAGLPASQVAAVSVPDDLPLEDVAAQVISGDRSFDRQRVDRGVAKGTPVRQREPASHGA